MDKLQGNLSILHIILAIRETSTPYNEHCLPWADRRDIAICTYFRSDIDHPGTLTLFEGNGSLTGFFRILQAALDAKEYDIIHAHSPHVGFLFLAGTLFSGRKFVPPTVITVHDSYPNYKLRNRLMFIPIFASFQGVICCSRASYNSFPALYKRLTGKRLGIVQNGLNIDRIDRMTLSICRPYQTSDFTIVAISRLVDIKNPFSVIAAFQQSTDQASQTGRLVYIGDGPLRQSLITRSGEVGPQTRIEFTGLIPREEVFEYLLNADLFISMSRGEGLPISVLEAMACRCPVLLSDIPPHREIAEGVDFIPLIQSDDVAGFAREIRKFREMPVSERTAIGQKCRELVEERFSLTAMHAGYEKIYAQIIDKPVSSHLETIR
ncbi:MAG: glycosyltransferase family 4 protein [Ardenticatenaceae bacterium]|nr:glycosyltransferase family 4 protein [Ardenticatenaceae bacterium]